MVSQQEVIKNELPNLQSTDLKSDKTDETDCKEITNDIFIHTIFGDLTLERPICVSFKGDPGEATKRSWFGQAYVDRKTMLPNYQNNYVSCSSYIPNDEGIYRRQKSSFAAFHWLLLDDVGVKVDIERVTLKPSWIIETSKGNFQYGFILSQPLRDATVADNLLQSIICAGLCDPGANGAAARIGRLPVAINGKYKDTTCKLSSWNPDCRYTVQEIVDGLQIELKERGKAGRRMSSVRLVDTETNDDVHIPRATDNPVLSALVANNLYKQPLGGGKHDITCPWVNEHTGAVDQGTAYWEPNETYPVGGFKCQHGHCIERRVSALYSVLGITKDDAKHLPIIKVSAGELNRIINAAEIELSKTTRHYQRGGIIVTVTTDPQTRATNVKTMSLPSLTRVVASLAVWQRFDKREAVWLTIDPPEKHIKILHDAAQYPHLPILNGIARQPYLRSDGSLSGYAGYDALTGMFGVFDARLFTISDKPTKAQAETALLKLTGLTDEFDLKTEHDKSAALSGILTAAIRSSLRLAPHFHVSAHQIGSGKSYLCQLLTLFATPEKSTPHSFPTDDDEMRKLLLAELLTAPAVIEFDNLTTDLIPHKSLCTALTSENISGRILGQSKTAEVGTRVLFLSSGNNVEPVRDMTRRVITIRLDPQCETPATREFKKNPVKEVTENRNKYIGFALTIIRAWIIAGRPEVDVKPINSFDEWSELCRQPLLWLGLKDPAQCVFETMAHDPDREQLGGFLSAWFAIYGTKSATTKDVVNDSVCNSDLRELIVEIAAERDGTINKKKLGWWIKRHSGRVVNGLRFTVDDSVNTNAAHWKIEQINKKSVSSVLSVSNPPLSENGSEVKIKPDTVRI